MTLSAHSPASSARSGPPVLLARGRRRSWGAVARVGVCTALAVVTSLLTVGPASASLAGVGPVAANGYPSYFEDTSGLRLRLCDDPAQGCASAVLPDPGAPLSYPDNFPGESFYYLMNSADGSYIAAVEAAYTGDNATPGQEILFNRIRVRIPGLVPGASYHITHPYGVLDLTANAAGVVNFTDDQGCLAPPCGDFGAVLPSFIGDASATSMNFVTGAGFNPATATAGTQIGDPATPTAVKGSPFLTNFYEVVGPNAGGPGVNVMRQDTFTVEAQVFGAVDPNRPSTPDLSVGTDTGRSNSDNITNSTTPTFTGTGLAGSAVELLVDGAVAGTGTVTAGGTYSLTPAAALSSALHSVKVRSGAFESGVLNIQVDAVGPASAIGSPRPTDGTLTNAPTFNFSGEAGSTFLCSLTPATAAVERASESCVSPLTYDAQVSGVYTFRVRAVDVAGNVGPAAVHTWRIGPVPTVAGTPRVGAKAPARPAAPRAKSGKARGPVTASVSWRAPSNGGSAIRRYVVRALRVNPRGAVLSTKRVTRPASARQLKMTLRAGKYRFTVQAVNAIGNGSQSARSNKVSAR